MICQVDDILALMHFLILASNYEDTDSEPFNMEQALRLRVSEYTLRKITWTSQNAAGWSLKGVIGGCDDWFY